MKQINLLHEFFNSSSDANEYLLASDQESLEDAFESWLLEKLDDFKFSARFLMKHMAEHYHPHTMCIVNSSSAELFEGQKTVATDDYIVD